MIDYLICGGELVTSSGTVPNNGLLVTRGKLAVPGALRPENLYAGLSCSIGRPRPGIPPALAIKQLNDQKCCCSEPCNQECVKIDAEGLYIAPGFIDMHVHGGNGCDALDGSSKSIREIAAFHVKGGTTSFLATVAPAPRNKLEKSLSIINALTLRNTEGAQLLGSHMEGPYLNPNRAGAINPSYLKDPDPVEIILPVRHPGCADGVGGQGQPPVTLYRTQQLEHGWVQVMSVGDYLGVYFPVGKDRPHQPRFPVMQGGGGVEQVYGMLYPVCSSIALPG
ncbi:MAG: amidohydrolase family protein, partial [Firmicutes bacterium]|nr:amidohydrolase family protein [Bacillota bacterium]